MIGFYDYTVIATYVSLVSAVVGINMAMKGCAGAAVICLLLSGLCDSFDGAIASTRKGRTTSEKRFGIQIDSLCDLISFGVLPCCIGYAMGMENWVFIALYSMFTLAALIRLAYFNVLEEERQQETTEKRKSYLGLPVTNSAWIFPIAYGIITMFSIPATVIFGIIYFVVAVLFITKFKVKKIGVRSIAAMVVVMTVLLTVYIVRMHHVI